ncbi:zf-CCHC domain-containing protein [Tanacetum coccineum]
MLVQSQGEAPFTSPSRITSSPSFSSRHTTSSTPTTPPFIQITHEVEETATMPYVSPLPGGHTLGSDEGKLKHDELMESVTKLSNRVMAVEKDLQQTKKTYSTALTKLVLKVKKLEKQVRSSKARRRARIVLSEDEDDVEDPSKQGRKIAQIDTDPTISLVQDEETLWFQEDIETQEKNSADTEVLLEETTLTEFIEDLGSGEKGEKEISTADIPVSTAGAEVSTASHDVSTAAAALTIDWSDLAVLRYHALQNRPYSVAEVRKNMVMYLKNQAGYKQKDKEKGTKKKSGGTRKKTLTRKRAGEKKSEESSKRQKKEDAAADYEQEKAELRLWLKVAQDDEESVNPEILFTNYLIVDWGYQLLGQVGGKDFEVYKLTRADGSASYHGNIQAFLRRLDREDMSTLYILVQERFQDHPLKGRDLLLWGDLRMIFNPDEKDDIWMNQLDWKFLKWKIHENESIDSGFAGFNTIITSLKSLDEGFSSKNYVRKFLMALHPKWRAKVTTIEESKYLSSLALDELIGNLKELKKFFRRKGRFIRQSREEKKSFRQRNEKKGKSDRKCFRCGDPNHLIGDCLKLSRNKDQKAFIGCSWSDNENDAEDKTNDETCVTAQSSNEVCLRTCMEPDEWIKDNGFSKHMIGNKSLLSTYKAYDRDNVVFKSNLKGKIIGKESLNVSLDESLPPTKLSPLVDDIVGEEEAIKRIPK